MTPLCVTWKKLQLQKHVLKNFIVPQREADMAKKFVIKISFPGSMFFEVHFFWLLKKSELPITVHIPAERTSLCSPVHGLYMAASWAVKDNHAKNKRKSPVNSNI